MQNQSTKQSFMLGRAHKIMCSDSNCKMFTHLNFQRKFWRARNEILKFKIFGYEKEIAERYPQIYSQREGSDSPGSFGYKRARKINFRSI